MSARAPVLAESREILDFSAELASDIKTCIPLSFHGESYDVPGQAPRHAVLKISLVFLKHPMYGLCLD